MPRTSTTWTIADNITATRLQMFNTDLDDLYLNGSDRLKVIRAISGTALKIDISAGVYRVGTQAGTGVYAGATDISVTNTATNYVEIDGSGTIQINTTGWTTAPSSYARLAVVTCAGGVITSIVVWRIDAIGGDFITNPSGDGSDGALNVTAGTTTIDASTAVNGFLVKQYTSFNISAGATLNFNNVPAGGIVFCPFVQGNWTCPGTLDLSNCGSDGAAAVTFTKTGNGTSNQTGALGTAPSNSLGQDRRGAGGNVSNDTNTYEASGGGGSSNSYLAGSASANATLNSVTATGATPGAIITAAIVALAAQKGITICPGAGGSGGGITVKVGNYLSGTFTATAAAGTKGGGSLLATVGGSFSFTGILNMGSANCSNSSASKGTSTGTNYTDACVAGGPSAGAAGIAIIFVSKTTTVTNSATVNASPGTPGTGTGTANTNGGAGRGAGAGDGGVSASGSMTIFFA